MSATMERVKARPDEEFLTLAEASTHYAVGKSTLRKLADAGTLTKHFRKGDKRLWFLVEELEREFRPKPVEERRDG